MSKSSSRPIAIDLFCGVGGMSLGFEQAGYNVVAAVDNEPINTETHKLNFPETHVIQRDIRELKGKDLRAEANVDDIEIDVVFGGPPCQGFSTIGRRKSDDPRNTLLVEFARMVGELEPKYFVMENVVGLLSPHARESLELFLNKIQRCGYEFLPIRTLNAQDFGVPQRRHRAIVLGYRRGLTPPSYPSPVITSEPKSLFTSPTVWDAIGDLHNVLKREELYDSDCLKVELGSPSTYAEILRGINRDPEDRSERKVRQVKVLSGCALTRHTPSTIERFSKTEPGKQEPITRYYRMKKEGIAPTLRAGTDKTKGSYMAARPIHPVEPRVITVREAARLHSYPDWFKFHSTRWHGFRQVGNSVPPRLARAIGLQLINIAP